MKKTFLIITMLIMAMRSSGSTIISSTTVSGHWTMAGSPYLVQVAATVQSGAALTIDPGVVVKFSPEAKLDVLGALVARGTATAPILFIATDTTGWSDETTTTGGWGGIHYRIRTGTERDSSAFEYCTVKDCKYGFSVVLNYFMPFSVERGLRVNHCNFIHNSTGLGLVGSGQVIYLRTMSAADTIEFGNCTISKSYSIPGTVSFGNYAGGYAYFHHNHLDHNYIGSALDINGNLLVEYNELDSNESTNSASTISAAGDITIRNNKIHHNIMNLEGAIRCVNGRIDIDNNIICNNKEIDLISCYGAYCTSGIQLSVADSATTYYRVRNNIIANNSSLSGGSALTVVDSKAEITNNTIVNNNSSGIHRSIYIKGYNSEAYIRNNIFLAPAWTLTVGTLDSSNLVLAMGAKKIQFDYNYMPYPFWKTLYSSNPYTLVGDTSHNIIGNLPGLIAPTADTELTTSALTANFGLSDISICVDKGDTMGAHCLPTDYLGNARVNGARIDIGAIEHTKNVGTMAVAKNALTIYPNPAHGSVTITTKDNSGHVYILDVTGKVVATRATTTGVNELPLAGIKSGLYILHYTSATTDQSTELVIE